MLKYQIKTTKERNCFKVYLNNRFIDSRQYYFEALELVPPEFQPHIEDVEIDLVADMNRMRANLFKHIKRLHKVRKKAR